MTSLSSAHAAHAHPGAFTGAPDMFHGLAEHKLSRLLELRAVIDAMRSDRESRDPLLSWAVAREHTDNS
jgi:hypothetical protein